MFEVLRQESASSHAETRHLFVTTAEKLRHEVQLVAESVVNLDEKVGREVEVVREEMRQGFATRRR